MIILLIFIRNLIRDYTSVFIKYFASTARAVHVDKLSKLTKKFVVKVTLLEKSCDPKK